MLQLRVILDDWERMRTVSALSFVREEGRDPEMTWSRGEFPAPSL